ncbi:MAG: class I tRNA ligase family protein [Chloroflexota bacterium]
MARNFANKLWNASRHAAQRPTELPENAVLRPVGRLGPAEHWILERCEATVAAVDQAYASFQLGEAARLLHTAIWAEYCDWYLELAKAQLAPGRPVERRVATWQVLAWVLDRYLRLLHPIMPHITEHLWARLPKSPDDPDLLIVARWPQPRGGAGGAAAVQASGTAELLELVTAIRNARTDAGIEAGTWLSATIVPRSEGLLLAVRGLEDAVERLARVRVSVAEDRAVLDDAPGALVVVTDQAEARLAATEADTERDTARIQKELAEAEAHLAATLARLADPNFTSRAPAAVVEGARQRAQELAERVERLRRHLAGPG